MLVVQAHPGAGRDLRQIVLSAGVEEGSLRSARTAPEALGALGAELPGAVALDVSEPPAEGMALLGELLVLVPGCTVLAIGDAAHAAEALARGAACFLPWEQAGPGRVGELLERACGAGERLRALRAQARWSAEIWDAVEDGVLVVSPAGRVLHANDAAVATLGRPRELILLGDLSASCFCWEDEQGRALRLSEVPVGVALETGRPVPRTLGRFAAPNGSTRWAECWATPVLERPGGPVSFVVVALRDVTRARASQAARRVAEERFRLGFEHGTAGMMITDVGGRIRQVNDALCDLFREPSSGLVGTFVADWVYEGDRDDRLAMRERLFAGEIDRYRSERRYVRRDGSIIWCLLNVSLIRDDREQPLYLFSQFQDITERKEHEAALERQATRDALTGLPNRLSLERHLSAALHRAAGSGRSLAVLFLDVDRFKLVNDGLGHVAGDRILVGIAERLLAVARPGDLVARFGGDEFVFVREDVACAAAADSLGRCASAVFDEPFSVDGKEVFVTVSCGIVLAGAGTSAEEALRDADVAMYEAKERGRARRRLFDERLRAAVAERFDLEQDLRGALDRGELGVCYQPIVRIGDGVVVGAEALVRWRHPGRGEVPPSLFVPVAEDSGLIEAIGAFVLDEALGELARWRLSLGRAGCGPAERPWVSVNLSSRQLSIGDAVSLCAGALASSGLEPGALRLELTESALMQDVESSVRVLQDLDALGVRIAIDDFGTGYSSLSYLSRLPVSCLKIDRSFVAGLGSDPSSGAIVRAVLSLAHSMGIEACAEGVERPEQLALLDALGCELGQGYLWAKPLAAAQLADLTSAGTSVRLPSWSTVS